MQVKKGFGRERHGMEGSSETDFNHIGWWPCVGKIEEKNSTEMDVVGLVISEVARGRLKEDSWSKTATEAGGKLPKFKV